LRGDFGVVFVCWYFLVVCEYVVVVLIYGGDVMSLLFYSVVMMLFWVWYGVLVFVVIVNFLF